MIALWGSGDNRGGREPIKSKSCSKNIPLRALGLDPDGQYVPGVRMTGKPISPALRQVRGPEIPISRLRLFLVPRGTWFQATKSPF